MYIYICVYTSVYTSATYHTCLALPFAHPTVCKTGLIPDLQASLLQPLDQRPAGSPRWSKKGKRFELEMMHFCSLGCKPTQSDKSPRWCCHLMTPIMGEGFNWHDFFCKHGWILMDLRRLGKFLHFGKDSSRQFSATAIRLQQPPTCNMKLQPTWRRKFLEPETSFSKAQVVSPTTWWHQFGTQLPSYMGINWAPDDCLFEVQYSPLLWQPSSCKALDFPPWIPWYTAPHLTASFPSPAMARQMMSATSCKTFRWDVSGPLLSCKTHALDPRLIT